MSYVLVRGRPGIALNHLAASIDRAVPASTASTRLAFIRSERRVVGDMSTDIVRGMTLVGFVVGVAVAALVAYSTMVAQLRDYAVLRAVGLRTRRALALVIGQISVLVLGGFAVALGLAVLLAATSTRLASTLVLVLRPGDVARPFSLPVSSRSPPRRSRLSVSRGRPGECLSALGGIRDRTIARIRGLTRTFGEGELRVEAVRGLDLTLESGEIVLIMGPSGSGKTTFLSMLGGLLRPTSGEVLIRGTDIAALPERRLPPFRARTFGFIFQDFNLVTALRARENVEVALNIAGRRGREARERASGC